MEMDHKIITTTSSSVLQLNFISFSTTPISKFNFYLVKNLTTIKLIKNKKNKKWHPLLYHPLLSSNKKSHCKDHQNPTPLDPSPPRYRKSRAITGHPSLVQYVIVLITSITKALQNFLSPEFKSTSQLFYEPTCHLALSFLPTQTSSFYSTVKASLFFST